MNFDFENGCKNEFKDHNENHAGYPRIGFLAKSISKPNGHADSVGVKFSAKSVKPFSRP